jgi:hypothetical protein
MEGYFQFLDNELHSIFNDVAKPLITEKNRYRICSFSGTYNPILLWTHYADGHTGVAIEITVEPYTHGMQKIIYNENIPEMESLLDKIPNLSAIDVLSRKIKIWSYEEEYRVIRESESNKCSIGEITALFWGIRTETYFKELILQFLPKHIKTYDTEIDFENNKIVISKD